MTNGFEVYQKTQRIPVIIDSKTIKIRQKKYLLHPDQTLGDFIYFLRQKGHIFIDSSESLYVLEKHTNVVPRQRDKFSEAYHHLNHHKDGFLYLTIEKEHWFG